MNIQNPSDRNTLITTALLSAVVLAGVSVFQGGLERLDQAIVVQCQTQDWPARNHQANSEYCDHYLAERAAKVSANR